MHSEDRRCERCEVLPEVMECGGTVLFVAMAGALEEKLMEILRGFGCSPDYDRGAITCEVESFKGLIERLAKTEGIGPLEARDTHVLFLPRGKEENYTCLKNIRTLRELLDIVKEGQYMEVLRNRRITFHAQPVLRSSDLRVDGFEMLVRGLDEEGNLIPPLKLLESAERTNTLFYFDRMCREAAIRHAVSKLPSDSDAKIFVNFSPNSIYDPRFCMQSTLRVASEVGLKPGRLVFEIVETQKVEDLRHLRNIVQYYKQEGVLVAMDDMGRGYANLDMLVNLKPNIVKIDREIVHGVSSDEVKRCVFHAIVDLCRRLEVEVLAEGVETEEDFAFAFERVDLVQGYFLSKPSPDLGEAKLRAEETARRAVEGSRPGHGQRAC